MFKNISQNLTLLNYKCLVTLLVEVIKKCKIIKNYDLFKNITRQLNKYIKDKNKKI